MNLVTISAVLTREDTAADVAGREMAPCVGCVDATDTAAVVTVTLTDDATLVVVTVFDAATDEVDGGFGGSCDFAPYSMYCKNTETSSH